MISISLCMIVKDEEMVISRCLDLVKDIVDEIIIVDTGSKDNTKEIVRKYTDKIYDYKWNDDFSAARNFSFSKAEKDYIMWLDADDIILEEDRIKLKTLKETIDNSIDIIVMKYNVGFDKDGNTTFSYNRERILKKSMGYIWKGEIHEAIDQYGNIYYSDIGITHKKVKENEQERNLKIFEKKLEKGKELNPREKFYYGRELLYNKRINEAEKMLNDFINLDEGWIENKISACKNLAECYFLQNKKREGLLSLLRSFEFDEPRAEICCDIGYYFFNEENYQRASFWYELALTRKLNKDSGGFFYEDCYGYIPYMQLCVCYDKMGNYKLAYEYNEKAGMIKPKDENYLYNKDYFKKLSMYYAPDI